MDEPAQKLYATVLEQWLTKNQQGHPQLVLLVQLMHNKRVGRQFLSLNGKGLDITKRLLSEFDIRPDEDKGEEWVDVIRRLNTDRALCGKVVELVANKVQQETTTKVFWNVYSPWGRWRFNQEQVDAMELGVTPTTASSPGGASPYPDFLDGMTPEEQMPF